MPTSFTQAAEQPSLKEILKQKNSELQAQFEAGANISLLLESLSQTIDSMLQKMWSQSAASTESQTKSSDPLKTTLVAVGGYGREEMHPASDVDLLILLSGEPDSDEQASLSDFVTSLWDLGLEIGHSVRTLDECIEEANNDLTVITNLIESRFLCGNKELFNSLQTSVSSDKIWSSAEFFKAKVEEQEKRYKHYGDSAYRVEPNLKEGPGGLRDLQTIGWIFNREYNVKSLKQLSLMDDVHLLNPDEYQDLIEARDFLWKVRFVLHQLTGRKTDRLLFDHQRHLAHSFGYTNDENNESIETFMQSYYRNITKLERLNEVLLGLLREHILNSKEVAPIPINSYYNNYNGYLGIAQEDLFTTHPHTLLEIFFIMQTLKEIKGLTPDTLRELRRNLHLIDDNFRTNPHNQQTFINIMSESKGITFTLHRMNRYGVLAAYVPAFANIVGRMQYDLFHVYTVDEHTLNVVRNIRRLSTQKGHEELPFCSKIFKNLHKPVILYLAGLFHDIAKGRGGSHSEKGAVDALEFCLSHGLNQLDAETVSWLVEQHLLLSSIAQRQDLSDPEVIRGVAEIVLTQERMDYLYLLTICDIRGTNPTLLNNWKHSLLKDLYRATKRFLLAGRPDTQNTAKLIETKKSTVQKQLEDELITKDQITSFWSQFNDEYIIQHSIETLTWHIKEIFSNASDISNNKDDPQIITAIRDNTRNDSSMLFVYCKDSSDAFMKVASAIEQHQLNIVAARITSSNDGYILDTFNLLNADGEKLTHSHDKAPLLETLEKNLTQDKLSYNFDHFRMPRQLKHFDTPTHVYFSEDRIRNQTIITIRTADQAGLLTRIGQVFNEQGVVIHGARISTLGEIAEDIFYITSRSGKLIDSEDIQTRVREALEEKLNT